MNRLCSIVGILTAFLAPTAPGQQDTLVAWGRNDHGQVSQSPSGPGIVQADGGLWHSVALRLDGSLVSWGDDTDGKVSNTPTGGGFIQVAAGLHHSLALKDDGSLVSWGNDAFLQVTNTPTGTGFTHVASGWYHSLALRADGSIASWGNNNYSVVSDTPSGTGFIQLAGGSEHSVALNADGSISCWGANYYGQSAAQSGNDFILIAAGGAHSQALRVSGSVHSWGHDDVGQLSGRPSGAGFVQLAAGWGHALALHADGSITSWGADQFHQVTDTPTGTHFIQIAAGADHSLALRWEDSDGDGLFDSLEDSNRNGVFDPGETDPFDQDTDDDGLSDGEEVLTQRPDARWLQTPGGSWARLSAPTSWNIASAEARAHGYELVSTHFQAEADWLASTFSPAADPLGTGFWIGLNDFGGTPNWSNGDLVGFTNWATNEPSVSPYAAFVGGSATTEPGKWYADLAGLSALPSVWESPGADRPETTTDPLLFDTDGDGLGDGQEDGLDSIIWDGGGLPGVTGTDPLIFVPDADPATTTDPLDLDSDDDGIEDGAEDLDADGAQGVSETDAADADSDDDGLLDGLELGLTAGTLDTNGAVFVPDADPLTTTDPLSSDTDLGGVEDGVEDQSQDGAVNTWETDPNNGGDETLAFYVSNLSPGQRVHFEVYNGTPGLWIFPAYSLSGAGPTSTTIGISVALSPPITTLPPALLDANGRASFEGPKVPSSVPPGFPVYLQGIEFIVSPTILPRVSNPILLPVGAF